MSRPVASTNSHGLLRIGQLRLVLGHFDLVFDTADGAQLALDRDVAQLVAVLHHLAASG